MVMNLVVQIQGHETPLIFSMERQAAYWWVVRNAEQIVSVDVRCNVHHWSWTAGLGWFKHPTFKYVPGRSVVRVENAAPVACGNGYGCAHPWRFSAFSELAANPLCAQTFKLLF